MKLFTSLTLAALVLSPLAVLHRVYELPMVGKSKERNFQSLEMKKY